MAEVRKGKEYYLSLSYTIVLRRDEEGDFVARIDELAGCISHGKTSQVALDNLEAIKEVWISECIESGQPVPEPVAEELLPSGKWVQRVPRSLHKGLTSLAKKEGVSLNALVTSELSKAVGMDEAQVSTTLWPEHFHVEEGKSVWPLATRRRTGREPEDKAVKVIDVLGELLIKLGRTEPTTQDFKVMEYDYDYKEEKKPN